ncbi:MAG: FAD-dependent tricarballylate dehydrogenase TcuA [Thaumarchaeota archaeon]|nr:FAD-dependent tricarballylate dehydrogenase TcuA [Nitrososphaerota archaeon]
MTDVDVIVVGGGNAGLCAALEAREHRSKVLMIERAPPEFRGGNSKYTRDIRCAHENADDFSSGSYREDEFVEDLLKVTEGKTNEELAKLVIHASSSIPAWMERQGVKWQKPLSGTLHLPRTNRFFLGGGKALINTYYGLAEKLGVQILYDSTVENILIKNGVFESVVVATGEQKKTLTGKSIVIAAGGFEANIEWLKEYWGAAADNFVIRGSRYNDGKLLKALMVCGARITGDPRGVHAIAVDARSPRFDGGIVTRVDSIPFGIVVNKWGERFFDEGEDLWPKRYAIWGKLIAEQPEQMAYSIIDSKVVGKFLPPLFEAIRSDTISGLAKLLDVDQNKFLETLETFNTHLSKGSSFDPSILDSCRTEGIDPPKTHWALPLDTPPYLAYPLRPGLTFTYMGVAVNSNANVLGTDGEAYRNVFAAGEIMAGNILTKGYLAGFGLTIGTAFGRIAGKSASETVA